MRIKRFNESLEDLEDIKDLILDFEDETDFKFELKHSANFINLIGKTKSLEYNKLEFIKKVYQLCESVKSFGYKNIDKGNVICLLPGKCEIQLQFVDEIDEEVKIPEINSLEEFKEFFENSLKLIFYEWNTELYLPNNDPKNDLQISLSPDQEEFHIYNDSMNYSDGNPNINWAAFKKEDSDFLESILIDINELNAHKNYDKNGKLAVKYEWAKLYDNEGNDLPPEEVKKLQKSFNSKVFKFDKKGAEVILKLYNILKDIKGDIILPSED
jgi:hypothetical protein